ncbi:hypothetical protein [Streptomyces sp. NPDC001933]|uniref:hypothetical protein n=1 Tax=Streptomyces sp. NPDC001933 TaxID=3364626 RepID=UPI003695E0C5
MYGSVSGEQVFLAGLDQAVPCGTDVVFVFLVQRVVEGSGRGRAAMKWAMSVK